MDEEEEELRISMIPQHRGALIREEHSVPETAIFGYMQHGGHLGRTAVDPLIHVRSCRGQQTKGAHRIPMLVMKIQGTNELAKDRKSFQ